MTESLSAPASVDDGLTPRERFIANSLRQKILYNYIAEQGGDFTGTDDPHEFAMSLCRQQGVTPATLNLLEALAAVRARPDEGTEL